jgi:hypothetical protein
VKPLDKLRKVVEKLWKVVEMCISAIIGLSDTNFFFKKREYVIIMDVCGYRLQLSEMIA